MNKIILIIAGITALILSTAITSCNKIELPDPKVDDNIIFKLNGFINKDSALFSTDNYFLKTGFYNDELGIRVFESEFLPLNGNANNSIKLKFRDNDIYTCCYEEAFMFEEGAYKFSQKSSTIGSVWVLGNKLMDTNLSGYFWRDQDIRFNGKAYYIENLNPNPKVRICIESEELLTSGVLEYCKELFPSQLSDDFDISIKEFKFHGNTIEPVFEKNVSGNLSYRWTGEVTSSSFSPTVSGEYTLIVSNAKSEVFVKFKVNLDQENNVLPFDFPGFSTKLLTFTDMPGFSQVELIYTNESGQVFSSKHNIKQQSLFKIVKSERLSQTDVQGNKVQLVDLDFSCKVYSESGDSISLDFFRGPFAFAFEK